MAIINGVVPSLHRELRLRAVVQEGVHDVAFAKLRGQPERCCADQALGEREVSAETTDRRALQRRQVRVRAVLQEQRPDCSVRTQSGMPAVSRNDSRGHWEGGTLVVEVTNFSDKTFGTQQPAGSYWGGGKGQRVVERFTRIDEGTIEYQATVEDPRGFTKPWTVVVPLLRDDDYVLYEYACHEGNYGLEQILKAHLGPGTSDSDGR